MVRFPGKKNVAVLISGRGSNLKALLKYSNKKNSLIKINLVISNNPEAKGLELAKKFKIKCYATRSKTKSIFEKKSLKLMKKYNVDIICLAGFMRILSANFIKKFSKPILNVHPSLLPKYKGLNTHARAIKNKDKYAGATIHKVNKKLDSGKIILQKKVKILKTDNVKSLEKKVLKVEHEIYTKAIKKLLTKL